MHYVVMLPLDPSPDKYHIWTQEELSTCCGTVKVLYKNESVDACADWLAKLKK